MSLSDIAAGIEVTHEQRERGVATVDDTEVALSDRLASHESALPCSATAAATVLSAYADGQSVGTAGHEAGVPPVTAAKTLHLLGVAGMTPLSPTARAVCRDWVSGRLSHAEARELTGATETEFALAAFIETHDPLEGVESIVDRVLADEPGGMVDKRDHLGETMSDVGELF